MVRLSPEIAWRSLKRFLRRAEQITRAPISPIIGLSCRMVDSPQLSLSYEMVGGMGLEPPRGRPMSRDSRCPEWGAHLGSPIVACSYMSRCDITVNCRCPKNVDGQLLRTGARELLQVDELARGPQQMSRLQVTAGAAVDWFCLRSEL